MEDNQIFDEEEAKQFGLPPSPPKNNVETVTINSPPVKSDVNWTKWFALGMGGLLGISHIAMIGLIAQRGNQQSKFPQLPVGNYTSYQIDHGENGGYRITYKANDPKVMSSIKDVVERGGFLGSKKSNVITTEQYVMDGAYHQGGPTSNTRSWIDPSAISNGGKKTALSKKTIECIEAAGSGRGTGKIVGSSIAAGTVAPAVANIPFIGWVAAGFATMFGGDKGGDIGAELATDYADCDDVDIPKVD